MFFSRLLTTLTRQAPAITGWLEAAVLAAFFSSMLLSFGGYLNVPLATAVLLVILTFLFRRRTRHFLPFTDTALIPPQSARFYVIAAGVIFTLMALQALVMPPLSGDGQRIKLARIILGVMNGSAWISSSVDTQHSTMYNFPTAFYLIFTPIEALHLPKQSYAIANTLLWLGGLLNVWLLLGRHRSWFMFAALLLFFAAPQFLFSALSEHEEPVIVFLVTRAMLWLSYGAPLIPSLCFAALTAALAVAVKYSTALFLPLTLLACTLFFADKSRIRSLLTPKSIMIGLGAGIAALAIALLPDYMVNLHRGTGMAQQMEALSHAHSLQNFQEQAIEQGVEVPAALLCALSHYLLRVGEFTLDGLRTFINVLPLPITPYMPTTGVLPAGCTADNPSVAHYLAQGTLMRESTDYGFIFVLCIMGVFILRARQRRLALLSLSAVLLPMIYYTLQFVYWTGIGRYFIAGFLGLLPAWLLTLSALRQRYSARTMKNLYLVLLFPAIAIAVLSNIGLNKTPSLVFKGDPFTRRTHEIAPTLATLTGPLNIYFNDLLPYYTLLRLIPSHDVKLWGKEVEGRANLIAIPMEFTSETNWHDVTLPLPVPSARGAYRAIGVTQKFGHRMKATYFLREPGVAPVEGVTLVPYIPYLPPLQWEAARHAGFTITPTTREGFYFIAERGNTKGLCLEHSETLFVWNIATKEACY